MGVGFSLLFITLHLAAMRNEILRRRVRSLRMIAGGTGSGVMCSDPTPPSLFGSYAVVAGVIGALIVWIAWDHRRQKRNIA